MSTAAAPRRVLRVAGSNGKAIDAAGYSSCCWYPTVQDAIDAVPLGNTVRTTIVVPPGVHRLPIYIPKTKNFITLAASSSSPETTVLSWDNTSSNLRHHQGTRVIGTGTFGCGSTIVEGADFIAKNITFENSAPQGSGQAVAIRVTADRCAFFNCRFLGWQVQGYAFSMTTLEMDFCLFPISSGQLIDSTNMAVLNHHSITSIRRRQPLGKDTLYLHYGKQYLKDCYIEGSVDFIFGNSTALLEHCHIHCKSQGFITAQSRKSSQETTGYVFLRCVITGNGGHSYMYLGRPWGPFCRVVFAYTWMDSCIKPAGWHNWDKPENERNACLYEYRCMGPGSNLSKRVTWSRELEDEEAEQFLIHSFIDPEIERPWLLQRLCIKIPYSEE